MMERMGYGLTKGSGGSGLNFGKVKRVLFRLFIPKGEDPEYYYKTRRGLSYVSTPVSSDSEFEKEVYHDSSSTTSSWDSDDSVGNIFESLSVNMVSTSHLEDDREDTFKSEELVQLDSDPWIEHLNTLWDEHFEQPEPPTEDRDSDKSWR